MEDHRPDKINAPFNDLLPQYFPPNQLNDILTTFLVDEPIVAQLFGISPFGIPGVSEEITQAGTLPAFGSTPITPPQIMFIYETTLPPGIDSTGTVTIADGAVVTPEPGVWILLLSGIAWLAWIGMRRSRASSS